MFELLIWCVYGVLVGSIAKSLVPLNQNFSLLKTIILGIVGSYFGGAILYLLGSYSSVSPTGIFMGIVGSVLALIVYKRLTEKNS